MLVLKKAGLKPPSATKLDYYDLKKQVIKKAILEKWG